MKLESKYELIWCEMKVGPLIYERYTNFHFNLYNIYLVAFDNQLTYMFITLRA